MHALPAQPLQGDGKRLGGGAVRPARPVQQESILAEYTKSEAQEWARETLRGQWTTLMTPFTSDGEVDEGALRGNIRRIRSLGTRGGGGTWAMGEFWSLTHDERTRIYDIVSDEASG